MQTRVAVTRNAAAFGGNGDRYEVAGKGAVAKAETKTTTKAPPRRQRYKSKSARRRPRSYEIGVPTKRQRAFLTNRVLLDKVGAVEDWATVGSVATRSGCVIEEGTHPKDIPWIGVAGCASDPLRLRAGWCVSAGNASAGCVGRAGRDQR